MKKLVIFVLLCAPCFAVDYYISKSAGNDANTAHSKVSPWQHLPGMASCSGSTANTCGGTTPVAGSRFFLMGCDTWVASDLPITWDWSGSSGNTIYIGVDKSWWNSTACPSGWNRPIFDLQSSGSKVFFVAGVNSSVTSWWVLDNIEMIHFANIGGRMTGCFNSCNNYTISNNYFHAWTLSTDDCKVFQMGAVPNGGGVFTGNVMDGSDRTGTSGVNGVCYGIYHDWPRTISNNVFKDLVNSLVGGVSGSDGITDISGNLIDTCLSSQGGVNHNNCVESSFGGTVYIHNNVINMNNGNNAGETMFIGDGGETDYVWDNVMYNITGNPPEIDERNGFTTLYFYNNTINNTVGGFCWTFTTDAGGTTPLALIKNNHCIGGGFSTGPGITLSNNLTQTAAQANANVTPKFDHYNASQTFVFSPTAATNSTVGGGANLTTGASWPAFPTSDTSYACTLGSVSGVVQPICPSRTVNTRPTSGAWDIGGYEFGGAPPTAASPTFSPTAGSYPTTQSIAISTTSGTTICYTTNGSNPVVNGAACSVGTLYSSPVSVGSTWLQAQAGGTAFTNSTVASARYILALAGGPLTYAARTDNCVTGSESGCIAGTVPGGIGSALSFRNQSSDPLPFAQLAPANKAFFDPDFGTYDVWATDSTLGTTLGIGTATSYSMAEGGSYWSADNSLLLVTGNGGQDILFYVNVAAIRARTCSPSTPCVVFTGIHNASVGDSTHTTSGASLSFTKNPSEAPNTIYELLTTGKTINKLVINGLPGCAATASCTLTRTLALDTTSNIPKSCSILPTDYHSNNPWISGLGLSVDGSMSFSAGGAGLWHGSTVYTFPDSFILPASATGAFQATVSGTSGTVEPTWCTTLGCTNTDGGVTWTRIGGIGGQDNGFDIISWRPASSCSGDGSGCCSRWNTRIGKIYRGTGVTEPSGVLTSDEAAAYYNLNGTLCANDGNVCTTPFPLTDIGTIHAGQGVLDPTFIQWTPTSAGAAPSAAFAGNQSCRGQGGAEQNCYDLYWQVATTLVRPCQSFTNEGSNVNGQCDGHPSKGYDTIFHGSTAGYYSHSMARPVTLTGAPNPGTRLLNPAPTWDNHGTYNSSNIASSNPPILAMTDVPSVGRLPGTGYTQSGYNETIGPNALGTFTQYRLGHNWNTGSSFLFQIQNAIGTVSQDGTMYAVATDGMETRGTRASPSVACPSLRADSQWSKNTVFASGARILDIGTEFIFQTSGGTSGSSQPTWSTCTTTCADNGMTWTALGANQCRGDVLVMDLLSANPGTIQPTFFGLHWKIANFPPLVPSGSVRLWDSLTRWQLLNPSNGVYDFTNLDTNLLDAKTLGVDVLFALSTTPNFVSSDPTNATCNYNSTANGGCGVPTDIAISCTNVNGNHNCDGKTDGTLQSWDLFIYNTLLHIQGLDPNVYQVPSSYEIWNEFTQQGTSGAGTCNQVGGTSWEGTCAQLALLYSHANCIITGRGVGCTAGAMGTPAVGLYPNAIVTTPDSVMTAPQSTQWGAYLLTSGALTNADVAAVHAYTQGGSCCALPETVVTRYNTASGLLATAGGTQPIWSTEGGWGTSTSETDVDLQAAFVARYYLLGWNAGFKRLYWYSYDSLFGTLWTSGGGLTKAGVAYGQIYGWMVGSVLSTPCTAVSTVYSCVLTNSTGDHLVMWDTAQTCSGGVCTTSNQNVASTWLAYQDMTTASVPVAIPPTHQVPIGAKPVIFQQSIITHGAGVNPVILGMNRGPK